MKNRTFAMDVAALSTPLKPKSAATIAMIRNITAQYNIALAPVITSD
jgi:hypothetical protein